MKYAQGSFITVPSREALRGLHPTAQTLYMWLCSYANETGVCFPSRKRLAEDCGCSEDTVDKMLQILINQLLLEKVNRIENGEKLSNLYTVLIEGGSRQNRVGYPITAGTVAARNGINSIHRTQSIEQGEQARGEVTYELDEDQPKRTSTAKYKDARIAFKWLPFIEESWYDNTTELKCGNLLYKRGEPVVKSLLRFIAAHKDDIYCPKFTKPSDLERKWRDYQDYANKND